MTKISQLPSKAELLDWFEKTQPDILCLQETKAHKEQVDPNLASPEGYFDAWNSAIKKGYSGTTTYSKNEPISVNKIREMLGTSQSGTSETISRLMRAGLVTKQRGPYDGRKVQVELTPGGKNLVRAGQKKTSETWGLLVSCLDDEEKNQTERQKTKYPFMLHVNLLPFVKRCVAKLTAPCFGVDGLGW